MNADKPQMNAERMKALDMYELASAQVPASPRLSRAWQRRWTVVLDELKAIFWSWA